MIVRFALVTEDESLSLCLTFSAPQLGMVTQILSLDIDTEFKRVEKCLNWTLPAAAEPIFVEDLDYAFEDSDGFLEMAILK